MAAKIATAASGPKSIPVRSSLPRAARRAVTRSSAGRSARRASGRILTPPHVWRAPSAETVLALTLLVGMLLNLGAFVAPALLSGSRVSESWRGPGISEAVLALVPLLSSLALLGIGAYCRTGERGPENRR